MSRYIDVEKLKAAVRDKYKSLPDRCEINSIIDLQPTADVRKNIKGKWRYQYKLDDVYDIKGGRSWAIVRSCDKCDFHVFVNNHIGQYNFCPNCGADMRGEE